MSSWGRKSDAAIADWWATVKDVADKKAIHKHLAAHYGDEIIETIIASAKAGVGPRNRQYRDYEPSYTKHLQREAAKGKPHPHKLRSAGRTGRAGGMLDPERFKWKISPSGRLFLIWTAAGQRMAIYGEVHQEGLALGKGGPRKKRKWMHVDSAETDRAVVHAYEKTIDDLIGMAAS